MNAEKRRRDAVDWEGEAAEEVPVDCVPGEARRIVPWTKQITVRGILASLVIGFIYSVIVMKVALTTGLVPNLNVSTALLTFLFLQSWDKLLERAGIASRPFTRQENTVIQTCAVACYGIAVGGGFGSYLLALNRNTYLLAGVDTPGNSPEGIKEPGIGWMAGFLFVSSFVGLLALVPLRKIMIIDYKLAYPSGTATAVLINGFHTPQGDNMAKYLRLLLLQSFSFRFYFDVSMTYIGAGMICSRLVNLSLLIGAVLSWGIMWPLIGKLKGVWFPLSLPESSMKSLNGYKVFISISLILGDVPAYDDQNPQEMRCNEVFLRDGIPLKMACIGYIFLSVISMMVVPLMFPELKWYYILFAYVLAPCLGFCNAYGAGLTDMNMAYNYGKVALFVLAAVSGKSSGVVAGLVGCGLIKSIVSISSDLMQDLKTGHQTLTSPRSMLLSQGIGTAIGCIIAPLTFFLFYKAFDVGNPDREYKAPYALLYRNMAILGVEGFSALPNHCLELCYGFFAFAVGANLTRDLMPKTAGEWVPLPMAMAVPFLVGAYFAIDMCVGSLIVFIWRMVNKGQADLMVPAVASGLICGDGLWILPSSILALAGVQPPFCMNFMASM
ncbi:hypothetical protein MLD38_025729 [Melastoma candidum]|uniref:Uncharacterized protein n=1 Tax=Melastoma candidum TaxID=119954 RepID=A0ACB9NX85_9MYRT|nr:hypothetical protein MLD38_025729 [Melastoma candidum]